MPNAEQYSYVGSELELFSKAVNWKRYWAGRLRPYVHGNVLDVGAGLGATFDYLADAADSWTCLEPDAQLCAQLAARLASHARPPQVICGTLEQLPAERKFDTAVYIDVLEHIEHDAEQVSAVIDRLNPGGTLIVLSPALPFLYSPFDESVGHFRRYTRQSLAAVAPPSLALQAWFFLDGLGVLASLFARFAKRSAPTKAQVEIWDKTLVPVSRITDALTSRLFGRSIVMVWTKQ
ncbi:MAG: class I SAM-dependent methyltransferase [Myxococcales bacterium]